MSWYAHDDDEFETIVTRTPCTGCINGRCIGRCNGSGSISSKRRPQAEIDTLRAKRLLEYEEKILREAENIRARRAVQ